MPDRFIETHIRQISMFQRLNEAQLDLIVQAFQVLRFQPGELVIQQGNATQGLFLLVSGAGALFQTLPDGSERQVGLMQEDDVLDRGALFASGIETVTLRVTEPTILLFLSRKRMATVLSYYPEMRTQLGAAALSSQAPPPIPTSTSQQKSAPSTLQRDNETVILERRRHPWSFVRRGWMALLLLLMFLALALVTLNLSPLLSVSLVGLGVVLFGLLMTYFYFEWRNDSFIITDFRVIRIERVIPTFSVSINEVPLDRIQEVNTALPEGDLFARIFDYGDVELKNASDSGDFVLDMIPKPEEVQKTIFEHRNYRREQTEENKRNVMRAEIERQLGVAHNPKATAEMAAVPASTPAQTSPQMVERSYSPARMRFTNTNGDTVIRKHISIWLAAVLAPLFVLMSGFIVLLISLMTSTGWLSRLGLPLALGMFVLGGLWFWWSDWDWRNDMYIIADDKVTLIHKRPLWLQNEVEQIILSQVDNVVSETKGFVDTLFPAGRCKNLAGWRGH
jgi:hypothetical protein